MKTLSFSELGIEQRILKILDKFHFTVPTPIQHQSISIALKGRDVIGIAQTGTGKTLAFGIPMLQKLISSKNTGLIILPTRELALQVGETLDGLGESLRLKTAVLIGGENMKKQINQLRRGPDIVIATPGRAIDHIERKTLNLNNVSMLVLDEADRMLDMGFAPQIQRILKSVPNQRQTMLYSATMPPRIAKITSTYMNNPAKIEAAPVGSTPDNVTHEIFFIQKEHRMTLLETILKERKGGILLFSRTKHNAKKICYGIKKLGHTAIEIHSNRTLAQRVSALEGFKKGNYKVLVATDVASRGIDATNIELVINYDLPECAEDYVHRIGRAGRAGRKGHAISFASPSQRFKLRDIEYLIKKKLPIAELPMFLQEKQLVSPEKIFSQNRKKSFGRKRFFNRKFCR